MDVVVDVLGRSIAFRPCIIVCSLRSISVEPLSLTPFSVANLIGRMAIVMLSFRLRRYQYYLGKLIEGLPRKRQGGQVKGHQLIRSEGLESHRWWMPWILSFEHNLGTGYTWKPFGRTDSESIQCNQFQQRSCKVTPIFPFSGEPGVMIRSVGIDWIWISSQEGKAPEYNERGCVKSLWCTGKLHFYACRFSIQRRAISVIC